ncbi:hypothetical protein WMY93_018538 [Mugilogobius chulae]|uniref:TSG101 and ALIX binding domain-containing protein n=1 Tax=Mugilogobius chulae TaxID=88201 RepID=A0AAW0NQM8_9GOBI
MKHFPRRESAASQSGRQTGELRRRADVRAHKSSSTASWVLSNHACRWGKLHHCEDATKTSPQKSLQNHGSSTARIIISNLKRENAFLLKTLDELAHHHKEHNMIIQKFLDLLPFRPSSHEYEKESTNCLPELMPEEQRIHGESQSDDVNMRRLSFYANEIEEIKDQLVNISSRCQYLETNVAKEEECAVDEVDNNVFITQLQMKLDDAIEKNKHWVEYDQQRETYVQSLLAKLAWLEKHSREVSEARNAERNEFLSDEKKKISQVERYYEGLMQKAGEQLDIFREEICLIQHALTKAQAECRDKQFEVDQLRQHLDNNRNAPSPPHITQHEEYLTLDAEDLQERLDKERRKSATLELQSGHLQKYFLNHYHKAQKQMAKFKQVIEVLVHDLCDERENCSYLKQQLERVQTDKEKDTEKVDNPEQNLDDPIDVFPLPLPNSRKSVLEESFIKCPVCCDAYPASQYSELIEHLDHCQL